jgi:hypothetical protein
LKITTYIILFFFSLTSYSQILVIDSAIYNDSIHKKWIKSFNFSLSSDKLKQNLLDVSTIIEIDRFFSNDYVLVGSLENDLTLNGNDLLQNEGYAQLRYRDNDKHDWSNESYIQYQWNGALGMENRKVLGSNIRKKIIEKNQIDLYTGLGVFYESEQWNWSGVENVEGIDVNAIMNRSLFRLNYYWKCAYKINENMDVSAASYFQLPVNPNVLNLRWFFDLNSNIKIAKNASFVIHYDHTYDDYRLVPISKYNYSLNFGIQIK